MFSSMKLMYKLATIKIRGMHLKKIVIPFHNVEMGRWIQPQKDDYFCLYEIIAGNRVIKTNNHCLYQSARQT